MNDYIELKSNPAIPKEKQDHQRELVTHVFSILTRMEASIDDDVAVGLSILGSVINRLPKHLRLRSAAEFTSLLLIAVEKSNQADESGGNA